MLHVLTKYLKQMPFFQIIEITLPNFLEKFSQKRIELEFLKFQKRYNYQITIILINKSFSINRNWN